MLGDVILIKGRGPAAALNLKAQRIAVFRLSIDEFTHVAMASGPHQVIHAMPSPWHIEIAALQEVLRPGYEWRVWRNAHVEKCAKADSNFGFGMYHEFSKRLNNAYNRRFYLRDSPQYAYCSQLVGQLAKMMGCPFSRRPSVLLPTHIAKEIASSDQWREVTEEYADWLNNDSRYARLYDNPNTRDALAYYASYLRAKHLINESYRAFEAAVGNEGPQSRVNVEKRDGLRVVSSTNDDSVSGLDGRKITDLPKHYHGAEMDWDRVLNFSTQWLDDKVYDELMSIEIPGRHTVFETGCIQDALRARHDCVLVLADEYLGKHAALMFDGVIPLSTDRIPPPVLSFGLPSACFHIPADTAARITNTMGHPGAAVRVKTNEGEDCVLDNRHPEAVYEANKKLIQLLYLRDVRDFRSRVALALANAGFYRPPLLLPSSSTSTAGPAAPSQSVHVAILGLPIVDVGKLSWEDIVDVRDQVRVMEHLRGIRQLFVSTKATDASNALKLLDSYARESERVAGIYGLPISRSNFGTIISRDAIHRVHRGIERIAIGLYTRSGAGENPVSLDCDEFSLNVSPVSSDFDSLQAVHPWIFVMDER